LDDIIPQTRVGRNQLRIQAGSFIPRKHWYNGTGAREARAPDNLSLLKISERTPPFEGQRSAVLQLDIR